jgi:hypothetical protein
VRFDIAVDVVERESGYAPRGWITPGPRALILLRLATLAPYDVQPEGLPDCTL